MEKCCGSKIHAAAARCSLDPRQEQVEIHAVAWQALNRQGPAQVLCVETGQREAQAIARGWRVQVRDLEKVG
eukprot:CAMPEP_0115060412 /NCGR_PEP_ID=MMETSP0227-20121206/7451_1 /TAXON_ID=89957 /ORGANISM="Polarella glacialis, Strain CCMP 1383" /LENGTH=71 /DNA_ID=CAMNT_0002445627 /DNA_START=124 /DNA_END=339 /DNA_ORIENTATION=-